jgi:RHS repeat-associated protein
MRRFSSSWLGTLAKLGFKAVKKSSRRESRERRFEALEPRWVFSFTSPTPHDGGNCPNDCPCSCSNATTTSDDDALVSSRVAGMPLTYNSGTQAHPTTSFNWPFAPTSDAYITFESIGTLAFPTTFYEVPDTAGDYEFTFQSNAGDLDSGRQMSIAKITNWTSGDVENGGYHVRTFQDIVNRDDSDFGEGWQFASIDRLVTRHLEEYTHFNMNIYGVSLITGDNHAIWFEQNTYQPDPNVTVYTRDQANTSSFAKLTKDNTTGNFTLSDPDGSVRTFDEEGLLLSRVDRLGNPVAAYTYDGNGRVETITDLHGKVIHFGYSSGQVTVTDFYDPLHPEAQQETNLFLDGSGRLTTIVEPDPDGPGQLTSPVTTYEYYTSGVADDLLKSVTDPRGLITTIEYDPTRHVSSITERCGGTIEIDSIQSQRVLDISSSGYDKFHLASMQGTTAEASDEIATVEHRVNYDPEHLEDITRNSSYQITSRTDAYGNVTNYDYWSIAIGGDPAGQGLPHDVTHVNVAGLDRPPQDLKTRYFYDSYGRLTGIQYPDLTSEYWVYTTDGNGRVTELVYIDQLLNYTTYDIDDTDGTVQKITRVIGGEDSDTIYTYTDGMGTTSIKGLIETILDPNDNLTTYTYYANGLVESITYADGALNDDEYTEEYEYDSRDRLHKFRDGRGNETEYIYDNLDRLIQRIDPDPDGPLNPLVSPVWNFVYDAAGYRSHVIDPLGNDTEYVYDERGRVKTQIKHEGFIAPPVAYWALDETEGLTATESADSGLLDFNADGEVQGTDDWVAGHQGNGFQFNGTTRIEAPGLMTEPADVSIAAWASLEEADTQGSHLVSLGDHFVIWLDCGGTTRASMFNGTAWEFVGVIDTFEGEGWHFYAATFDDTANLFKLYIDGELANSITTSSSIEWSGLGSDTVIGRHALSGIHTSYDFTGIVDDVGIYDYALSPEQVAELYASGPTTRYEWDCNSNLVKETDPMGRVTEYDYDALNRLISRTDPDPDGASGIGPSVTRYTYNSLGWLTSTTDPEQNVTLYQYDEMGRQTKQINVVDSASLLVTGSGLLGEYRNGSELLHSRVDETVAFEPATDFAGYSDLPDGFTATWTGAVYFEWDVQAFSINGTDYSQLFIDDSPVVTHASTPGTTNTSQPADVKAGWHTVRVEFSDTIDESQSGLTVIYEFSEGASIFPPENVFQTQVTTYDYDALGRMTSLIDPGANETTWTYNDDVLTTTEALVGTAFPRVYEYDPNGNLKKKTDRNGRVITYSYDGLNRLKSEKWYTDETAYDTTPNSPLETISYAYDDANNLTSVSDDNATYEYEYDGLNRRTDATQSIFGLTPSLAFDYGYDVASRLTNTKAFIGTTADYANDYDYDYLNRLKTVTQDAQSGGQAVAAKRVDFTYNLASQLTGLNRYANVSTSNPVASTELHYDLAGRPDIVGHVTTATGSDFSETHTYGFDKAGRIVGYNSFRDEIDINYVYDSNSQLTNAEDSNTFLPEEAYQYDANGNRQSYTVDAFNRVTFDGTYRYQYDDEGNLTAKYEDVDLDEVWDSSEEDKFEYTWDHRNRLIQVVERDHDDGNTYLYYAYDAFNQLVLRQLNRAYEDLQTATVFVHENGQIALQFDAQFVAAPLEDLESADLSHRYLWNAAAVDQLLADEQVEFANNETMDGEVLWALTDNLGSVRDVIDSDGQQRIHRDFDAFGNMLNDVHVGDYVDEAFAFTGRWFDKTTGLQNNLNRWYDPKIGRWMSEDPIGFMTGDTNLFRYVGNEPTGWIDPRGLEKRGDESTRKSSYSGKNFADDFVHWVSGFNPPRPAADPNSNGTCWRQELKGKTYPELVNDAKKRYPKKADKIENHHIIPIYLGGSPSGPTVPLNAAYHQDITNACRRLWPYDGLKPGREKLIQILDDVYSKYPLPPGTTFQVK